VIEVRQMRVGDIEVVPVLDGQLIMAEPAGFPAEDSPEFVPHRDYISDGLWIMDIGSFVVRSGDRVVLLDAGAGPGDQNVRGPGRFDRIEDAPPAIVERWRGRGMSDERIAAAIWTLQKTTISHGRMAESLAEAGIAPADVTDVVASHLHHDHIGWVSKDGEPFFPKAAIRMERRDLDHFLGEQGRAEEPYFAALYGALPTSQRLEPVLDRIEPWDGDAQIAPGIEMVFAPGHTPGNSLAVLSSGNQRAMVLGDTVHCPLELTDPDFSLMGDMDQNLADRSRALVRRELEADPTIPVAAPHFPGLRFGRILPGTGKHGWVFDQYRG
jgi:glyoxylase-like metal-dependent hydrolase (beta-lactamase superfamily II)